MPVYVNFVKESLHFFNYVHLGTKSSVKSVKFEPSTDTFRWLM